MADTTTEGRLAVSVMEAGRMVGLRRGAAYAAVKNGRLPSVRVGGRVLVPLAPLRAMFGVDGKAAAR